MSSVCRVCLAAGNTTMHSLIDNQLIDVYDKLSSTKFNSEDTRPRALCSFCYRKLLECHTFSQMAHRSEKIFSHLIHQGLETTQEYITEVNRDIKQQFSVATMQYNTIDDNTTNAGSQITIKDEPIPNIDIKEEVITEQDKLVDVEPVPVVPVSPVESFTKSQILVEDNRDRENYLDELPPTTNAGPQVAIKDKLILYIDIKEEEVITEQDKLVDIEPVLESFTKSQILVEDNRDLENDVEELSFNSPVEQTQPEDSKMHLKRRFYCNLCNKQFSNKPKFVIHKRIHTGEKPFACDVCDKKFNRKDKLVEHKRIHTGEKPFACDVCDKKFKRKHKLVEHKRIHTGEKPFACDVCDKKFIRKDKLVEHKRTHIRVKHFANLTTNAGSQVAIKDEPILKEEKVITEHDKLVDVEPVPESFTKSHILVEDNRDRENDVEELPSNSHVEQNKPDDSKMLVKRRFICNVCDKQFSKKISFVNHKRIHTGEKPFACDLCDKKFKRKDKLVEHKRTHTGEKPFVCNVCDKQFYRKDKLVEHKRTHTGVKHFACNVCDKQYYRKDKLVEHKRTHTGEKPFICDVCNKQFCQNHDLVRHMRIHTGEKPFICNVCDKRFNQNPNLVRHMRVMHTGVKPFA